MRLFWILIFMAMAQNVHAVDIRVRIFSEKKVAHLEAQDFKILADSHRCLDPSVKIKSHYARLKIEFAQKMWNLTNEETGELCQLHSRLLNFHAKNLKLNGVLVSPQIIFDSNRGRFDVISEMDLEKYLVGVLTKELPANFPLEAFKAQAIASRSYAVKKILASQDKSFDLESGVEDQVYQYSNGSVKIQTAVDETKNLVLENQKGKLFPVYYHADCGGHTEEPSEVWGGAEKVGTVTDAACPLESHSHWNFSVTKTELTARLRVVLALGDSQIDSIDEFENTSSGRKKSLKIYLDDHSVKIVTGQQLRNILGYDRLKSTLFALSDSGLSFHFEGKGFGHGVGMCQWGARHLALTGKVYPSILKHYFPQAKLAQIPASWTLQ